MEVDHVVDALQPLVGQFVEVDKGSGAQTAALWGIYRYGQVEAHRIDVWENDIFLAWEAPCATEFPSGSWLQCSKVELITGMGDSAINLHFLGGTISLKAKGRFVPSEPTRAMDERSNLAPLCLRSRESWGEFNRKRARYHGRGG